MQPSSCHALGRAFLVDRSLKIMRCEMKMPGFTAESSLSPTMDIDYGKVGLGGLPSEGRRKVVPQLRLQPGGAACYWSCRRNGVDDLTCHFFCGLRPFTIGGLLIAE